MLGEQTTTHPPATISTTLQCSKYGSNGWCTSPATVSLAGNKPLAGYSIITLEGTRNGQAFTCIGSSCSVPLIEDNLPDEMGDMALSMKEAGSEPDLELAGILLDGILVEQTGHAGFTGFMLFKAQLGGTLDTLLEDLTIAPSPLFAWGYWLLEWAIIAWLTVRGAYRKARPAPVPA